jgi:hypothetical protein
MADRGMISKDTIAQLEDHAQAPFDLVLGCRMSQQKEVSEEVLARAGRYQKVASNLEVKEPDLTVAEVAWEFHRRTNRSVSPASMSRTLRKLGLTRKRRA